MKFVNFPIIYFYLYNKDFGSIKRTNFCTDLISIFRSRFLNTAWDISEIVELNWGRKEGNCKCQVLKYWPHVRCTRYLNSLHRVAPSSPQRWPGQGVSPRNPRVHGEHVSYPCMVSVIIGYSNVCRLHRRARVSVVGREPRVRWPGLRENQLFANEPRNRAHLDCSPPGSLRSNGLFAYTNRSRYLVSYPDDFLLFWPECRSASPVDPLGGSHAFSVHGPSTELYSLARGFPDLPQPCVQFGSRPRFTWRTWQPGWKQPSSFGASELRYDVVLIFERESFVALNERNACT